MIGYTLQLTNVITRICYMIIIILGESLLYKPSMGLAETPSVFKAVISKEQRQEWEKLLKNTDRSMPAPVIMAPRAVVSQDHSALHPPQGRNKSSGNESADLINSDKPITANIKEIEEMEPPMAFSTHITEVPTHIQELPNTPTTAITEVPTHIQELPNTPTTAITEVPTHIQELPNTPTTAITEVPGYMPPTPLNAAEEEDDGPIHGESPYNQASSDVMTERQETQQKEKEILQPNNSAYSQAPSAIESNHDDGPLISANKTTSLNDNNWPHSPPTSPSYSAIEPQENNSSTPPTNSASSQTQSNTTGNILGVITTLLSLFGG